MAWGGGCSRDLLLACRLVTGVFLCCRAQDRWASKSTFKLNGTHMCLPRPGFRCADLLRCDGQPSALRHEQGGIAPTPDRSDVEYPSHVPGLLHDIRVRVHRYPRNMLASFSPLLAGGFLARGPWS